MTETQDEARDGAGTTETATFGAGCFWKPESAFKQLEGVVETAVGYEGGTVENPSYEQVCSGTTGHAEVCEVSYDPERISYEQLLDRFWRLHDATQVDRQGPDVGTQYRSVIFAHTPQQAELAEAAREREQGRVKAPIATSIEPAQTFWRAEEYHQCYLENRQSPAQMLRELIGR
ncbi:MAG: peptide-methionine (S)-S-oxide reductase MsrA [Solirubrobacterales bacterium]|nr:peptide-methionine (S)-S-oxide reductase MsrA [Solirubrobacterales bacterium]